ncbi:MAG TPA: hypothetical protein VN182_04335 [Flavobacterium sp.]|nr:hypothetical protein [Flavobacterium sp.]
MKIKFLLLISIIALSSCKKDNPKIEEHSKFVKVWFDTVRSYPFKAKLIIKKDKTFEYRGGACTSSFGAKGIWRIENDTIILNSIKPKECMWKHDFGLFCLTFEEMKLANIEEDNKTIKDCEPQGENSYENFENEKFYFRNDTLIHKNDKYDKMTNCPKLIIAFSDKEKIRK